MTVRACAAATASLIGAAWGCGAASDPMATVDKVSPKMAYNNAPTTLQIGGGPFRPAYRFDTMAGAASANAGGFSVTLTSVPTAASDTPVTVQVAEVAWLTINALVATIPAAVPAGAYDVAVTDPRGRRTDLPGGFTSLGPDEEAPIVTIEAPKPGSIIGAETLVSVTFAADDGAGHLDALDAKVTPEGIAPEVTCPPTAGLPQANCQFQFIAPAPTGDADTIVIEAEALDNAGNRTSVPFVYRLARRPLADRPGSGDRPGQRRHDDRVCWPRLRRAGAGSDGTQLLIDGHPSRCRRSRPPRSRPRRPATTGYRHGDRVDRRRREPSDEVLPVRRQTDHTSGDAGERPATGGNLDQDRGQQFPQSADQHHRRRHRSDVRRYFDGPNRILGETPRAARRVGARSSPPTSQWSPTPGRTRSPTRTSGADPPDGGADPTNCDGTP